MDYHQNARLMIHQREQLARKVLDERCTLKLAAASFNVSAKTAAKWVRRYRANGVADLRDRSSRPHRSPRQTDMAMVAQVERLRRLGLNRLRSLDPPPPVVRYEHKHPGDLLHFDIKRGPHRPPRPSHPRRPLQGSARRRLGVSLHRHQSLP